MRNLAFHLAKYTKHTQPAQVCYLGVSFVLGNFTELILDFPNYWVLHSSALPICNAPKRVVTLTHRLDELFTCVELADWS